MHISGILYAWTSLHVHCAPMCGLGALPPVLAIHVIYSVHEHHGYEFLDLNEFNEFI